MFRLFDNRKVQLALFLFLLFTFCYFRLKPIYLQTVPYTYDQGRDFLKVEEIIRYKNPTLLGPTTGVMGIYHGVQWYYYLGIPYLLFNGNPNGFVFFIFLTHLISFLIFFVFLYKKFNPLTALFALFVSAGSPYFITMSSLAISSTPEISLILFFVILLYKFLETKKPLYQILLFLNLGLIFEQELPVGIFLIPSLIVALLITKQIKNFTYKLQYLLLSLLAFIIPSIPRILFEIKHNFIQAKVAIDYILHAGNNNTSNMIQIAGKRMALLSDYYRGLFIESNGFIAFAFLIIFCIGLWFVYRRIDHLKKNVLNIFLVILSSIFGFTMIFKNEVNGSYLDGLPVIYLSVLSIIFYQLTKMKNILRVISFSIIIILFILNLTSTYSNLYEKKGITKGISRQIQVLEYLKAQNQKNGYCLKIYTPPVIPYTYNYLISYNSRVEGYIEPSNNFVNNQCWFVIEKEQEGKNYQDRITKWRKENIPQKAKIIKKETMKDGTLIELWTN